MGKKLADLTFTNRLYKKVPFLFVHQKPTPLKNPALLHVNTELLNKLEIDVSLLSQPSFLRFINGDLEFDGLLFAASFYSGHQFGHYVPRLGDGRALMLGEIKTELGDFYELQLKGSGLTPFSRMGDGKAVVRSSLREYLASVHLNALHIPSTSALAVIRGEDDVYREEIEKSAIVLRVAESFLRFGHYQYYAQQDQHLLKELVEETIVHYFSDYASHPNRYVLFFQDVVKKTAQLFAKWQAVGFCHGVLNTDNMSILGLTLDYGPYGFIDHFDLDHICNHSDHEGRYSYGNQPEIGEWNLRALAHALSSLISTEDLERTLKTYPMIFNLEYQRIMKEKCGLYQSEERDRDFIRSLLNMLVESKIDYTQFFRRLSYYQTGDRGLIGINPSIELEAWLALYQKRLTIEMMGEEDRREKMLKTNPKFILRNYLAQMAIENHELIDPLFKVLSDPFSEWPDYEEWSKPAPKQYQHLFVSCSS